jgi:multicomponent Na+:H+ antiporter subunit A
LSFDLFAILLLLAPFALAPFAPLISGGTGRAAGWILAIVPAGMFVALASTIEGIAAGNPIRLAIDWVPSLGLSLSFLIDGLALVFALMITGIGAFILIYAARYLEGHAHRGRFLAIMLAFMGAMLGLVLADSFVALFVFWELTSVASFLLIGFDHERQAARRAAFQALVITGMGGLALMAAGVLFHAITGSWNISALAGSAALRQAGAYYPVLLGLVVLAAFTKSAQWPFHSWLPNAMEAPTPVSAYLHSATMVQAGVYLLARLSPVLSGGAEWQVLLCTFGGITLLWGALNALRQSDMKQMLAQTTLASLGLSVFMLGIGNEAAAMAVAAYFVAHALYKAGLFLVTGIIDHSTGTRDITQLGGLRDHMTITFICAGVAGLSMFGVPPLLGYIAKEEVYLALSAGDAWGVISIAVLVLGNAMLGAVALVLAIRPYMGALKPTPHTPHEAPFAMWAGPALFAVAGIGVVFAHSAYGDNLLAPMASSIAGTTVESHLTYAVDFAALPVWLSILTWVIGGLIYWRFDEIRALLVGLHARLAWTWDKGFDQLIFGLLKLAGSWTRTFHHGRLELYFVVAFAAVALVILVPLASFGGWPSLPSFVPLTLYEWAALALTATGAIVVVFARTRLGAIIALGLQGLGVALIFLFFGAPDLAFTQLMVEILSVVILALVMTRLNLTVADPRPLEDWARDGFLALVTGGAVALILLRVLEQPFNARLSDFFTETSVAIAHGHNIVNVILVDYRGIDTLGEITVVMTAGIAVLALLRRQHKRPDTSPPKPAGKVSP